MSFARVPLWLLRILIAELPAIEAEQLQAAATAAAMPWLPDDERRRLAARLSALAAPAGPPPPDVFSLLAAGNLDTAAEELRRLGITVTRTVEAA